VTAATSAVEIFFRVAFTVMGVSTRGGSSSGSVVDQDVKPTEPRGTRVRSARELQANT
jgi:hypothetical protein